MDEVPEHLLVIGGGYIGLELSQAMRRFGSKVTLIEHNERLVSREDEDVSEGLRGLFLDEGIEHPFEHEDQASIGEIGRLCASCDRAKWSGENAAG